MNLEMEYRTTCITIDTLAARAGTFRVNIPTMTAARIGTLKKPKQDWRKSYRPEGAKLTTGATQIETMASTVPKILPMRTSCASVACGLNSGR